MPSPHGGPQFAGQPSPETLLPSSHASPGSRTPLPQVGCTQICWSPAFAQRSPAGQMPPPSQSLVASRKQPASAPVSEISASSTARHLIDRLPSRCPRTGATITGTGGAILFRITVEVAIRSLSDVTFPPLRSPVVAAVHGPRGLKSSPDVRRRRCADWHSQSAPRSMPTRVRDIACGCMQRRQRTPASPRNPQVADGSYLEMRRSAADPTIDATDLRTAIGAGLPGRRVLGRRQVGTPLEEACARPRTGCVALSVVRPGIRRARRLEAAG